MTLPRSFRISDLTPAARTLMHEHEKLIHQRCDRMFGVLFVLQWVGGLLLAYATGPLTWRGSVSAIHPHVPAAAVLGLAIISLPLYLILMQPGKALTRQVIAAGQMLSSALLIHLGGGRIEMHFHVFGSLAFLAFYRDWRVLLTGTVIVTADHMLRGIYLPRSVFGVPWASQWRWLEHTAWVLFEDVFLVLSCLRGRREMAEIATRQAQTEQARSEVELEVQRRTTQLKASETRFRTLVEGTGVIVWEFDRRISAFTYLSPQVADLGYSIEQCHSPGFWESHLHEEDRAAAMQARADHAPRAQYRFIRADGAAIWIDDVTAGESENGVLRGVMIDITERKHLEIQLSQSQRLESIGQLAAGIAHEINTPTQYIGDNIRFLQEQFATLLSVVEKYALLLDPQSPPAPWMQRHDEMLRARKTLDFDFAAGEIPGAILQSLEGLHRVETIVRAMKEFSHPGHAEREPADLNRAIASTVEVCRNRWKYVADLQMDLDPRLPAVPCLVAEFNQVILNLVVNAADALTEKFGDEGARKGLIRITTRSQPGWVQITVCDNGPGIPEPVRQRIFEPFFTTKPVGRGTGQGLTLSRNVIVRKHGGELTFSTAVGEGTTFTIRLPIEQDAGQKEAA